MGAPKEQIPRQDLPDEGSAVPSELSPPEGSDAGRHQQRNPMAPAKTRKGAVGTSTQVELLKKAQFFADEVVNNAEVDELDWPAVLRNKLSEIGFNVSPGDISRYLRQSKSARDGRKDFGVAGDLIEEREAEWLWDGIVMRKATNLVYAMPKCGKTRLILAMLAAHKEGRSSFAQIKMHESNEKLLLLGPDQSERSWGSYLRKAGIVTDGKIPDYITAYCHSGTGFCLDEYWFSRIEGYLKKNGPLIVLLDSYSAAIRGLGIDENKAEGATPLMQLHNLVNTYDSTLIVIHHTNKGAREGTAGRTSRGNTAIPAVADNLIEMSLWQEQPEEGKKKYQLQIDGRAETAGVPLIAYDSINRAWESCGSAGDAREEAQKDSEWDRLTADRRIFIELLCEGVAKKQKTYTPASLLEAAEWKKTSYSRARVNKALVALMKMNFVREVDPPEGTANPRVKGYEPTPWAMVKYNGEPSHQT